MTAQRSRSVKTFKLTIVVTIMMYLSFVFSGCALYHHYGPYYGKLIDDETKQPLEGAVVLSVYNTWLWASPGGEVAYFLDAQEVVSDKNGEFKIPSLNAFAFRPLSTFNHEPYFTIFKPRYSCDTRRIPEDQYEIVGMKKLQDKEARVRNTGCFPTIVPDNKMRKLIEVNNIESIDLGLRPTHLQENKK